MDVEMAAQRARRIMWAAGEATAERRARRLLSMGGGDSGGNGAAGTGNGGHGNETDET